MKEIPKVKIEWNIDHHEWWNVYINEEWLISVKDLNLAVKFIYSVCGKEAFGPKLEPWKKY